MNTSGLTYSSSTNEYLVSFTYEMTNIHTVPIHYQIWIKEDE